MGLDLIVAADSRSGSQDGLEAWAAAKLAGDELPRRRSAGVGRTRPSWGGFERGLGREAPTRYA